MRASFRRLVVAVLALLGLIGGDAVFGQAPAQPPAQVTAEEIRLVIREAAKSGLKVEGHVQTERGARNAIEAGIWSIAHSGALTDEFHKLMAQKGIWRAGTETPSGLEGHPVSEQAYQRTVAGLKNAPARLAVSCAWSS